MRKSSNVYWFALPILIGALAAPAWADPAPQAVDKTKQAASKAVEKTKETARDAGDRINDAWLTTKVKAQYWGDDVLEGSKINVDTRDSVVYLKGTVPSAEARQHAIQVAGNTEGVTKVIDSLKTAAPKDRDLTKAAKETTKEAWKDTKRETKELRKDTGKAVATTGQVINDAWITTKVKAQYFGDNVLEGSRINVDTANFVVTLKGTVPTEAARKHAIQVARKTEGVKSVTDQLTIGPKSKGITPVK